MSAGTRLWALALLPILLLAMLVWAVVAFDPARALRGDAPPVEVLVFERVTLDEHGIHLSVLNDGPDPVTIAQVAIDEAYWTFSLEPTKPLLHLERARLDIPYPWVEGELHELRLVTATGVTFDHEISVATATPGVSSRFLWLFALVGIYVGVIPVALGLLWYPMVGRLGRTGLDFVLALTVGLLLFLLVDAVHDGLEVAAEIASSYQGTVLFVAVAGLAWLAIEALGARLQAGRDDPDRAAWITALLVATGIGLHNLGEGLAIGAAFSLGEVTLGTLLIVGFMLHNTTEGLAIVAPLARSRTPLARLALLGLVAGAPTILGAWIGGFTYSPVWALAFLAVGAGAIAQVSLRILHGAAAERTLPQLLTARPVIAGLLAGVAVMYATGMLVG